MKQIGLLLGLAVAVSSAPVFAQDVDVDTFETYGDSTALKVVWSVAGNLPGEDALLMTSGGANSTSNYMLLTDGGFSVYRTAPDIVTPAAGNYRLRFYWRNGVDGGVPWKALKVNLTQNESNIVDVFLSPATNPPVVSDWTLYESSVITLDGTNPISMTVSAADNQAVPEGQTSYNSAIDEIKLVPVTGAPPQLTVSPDERIYLSRTETITAVPSLGSETYTKVEFDVNDDGVDFTDTSAPYEFEWDTLLNMPQSTSGSVTLKVIVTDSNMQTGSVTHTYTVDNEYDGRRSLVSTDFSTFTDGVPAGWVVFQDTDNSTYGPGPDRNNVADQALLVNFTVSDFTNRYVMRSEADQGAYYDLQTWYWGRGSSNRLYYATSTDGATFTPQTGTPAASVNSSSWTFAVGVAQNLGLTDADLISVATHQFAAGNHSYDDVNTEANMAPATSEVDGWNLY